MPIQTMNLEKEVDYTTLKTFLMDAAHSMGWTTKDNPRRSFFIPGVGVETSDDCLGADLVMVGGLLNALDVAVDSGNVSSFEVKTGWRYGRFASAKTVQRYLGFVDEDLKIHEANRILQV